MVVDSSIFPRSQVTHGNIKSLGLVENLSSSKQHCFLKKLPATSSIFSQVTSRTPIITGKATTLWKAPISLYFLYWITAVVYLCLFFFSSVTLSQCTAISAKWHFISGLHGTTMSLLLCWMTWSVWVLKSYNILTLPLSTWVSGLPLYNLTSTTNPNFWHSSMCTILATLARFVFTLSGIAFCLMKSSEWLTLIFPRAFYIFLISLDHSCSFLSTSFWGIFLNFLSSCQ